MCIRAPRLPGATTAVAGRFVASLSVASSEAPVTHRHRISRFPPALNARCEPVERAGKLRTVSTGSTCLNVRSSGALAALVVPLPLPSAAERARNQVAVVAMTGAPTSSDIAIRRRRRRARISLPSCDGLNVCFPGTLASDRSLGRPWSTRSAAGRTRNNVPVKAVIGTSAGSDGAVRRRSNTDPIRLASLPRSTTARDSAGSRRTGRAAADGSAGPWDRRRWWWWRQ